MLLALVFSLFSGMTVSAAGRAGSNTGVRHQICTGLSGQAESYYDDAGVTYEQFAAMEGDASGSCLQAVDCELYAALHDLMESTMTNSVSYKSLTSYWPITDATGGSSEAVLFYSDYVSGGYNREHVWPKSRGSFYQSKAGSDLHHLRPTDTTVNSTRGNMTMGNVRGVIADYRTCQNGGKDVLYYSTANDLVEINDNIKGDVARIFLYVYVRWEEPNLFERDPNPKQVSGDTGGNNGLKVIESLDTLLQWCKNDPVDDWEMQRNNLCEDVQGNRNVFIDYPELAWQLFGREVPGDMQTPSGKAQDGSVTYTVTAATSDPEKGAVTMTGRTITAVPADGCYAAGAVVSPAGAATVTRNGSTFRVANITADCTVTVLFEEKRAAVVAYRVPAGVSANGPTSAFIGDPITLPQVSGMPEDDVHDYTFLGWATDAVEDTTDRESFRLYPAGSTYTLNAPMSEFYAVYSYKIISGNPTDTDTFRLVSEERIDWSGDYVFTGTGTESDYVLLADGSLTGSAIGSADAAVPFAGAGFEKSGELLENVTESYVLTVEKAGDGTYSIALKGASAPTYLAYTGSKNSLDTAADNTDPAAQWSFGFSGGNVTVTNAVSPDRFMQFNASATMFRCYTAAQKPVVLYAAAESSETHYLTLAEKHVCTHENTDTVTVDAACEKDGSVTVICTDCQDVLSITVLPALGHNIVKDSGRPASCEGSGLTEGQHCTRCNDKTVALQTIPALGHDIIIDEGRRATCEDDGLTEGQHCNRCDNQTVEQEIIPALGHDFCEWGVTKKAACDEAGEETRTCSRCDRTEHREIPATGHTFGPWEDEKDGKTHYRTCTCGEAEVELHHWDAGKITKQPTKNEEGIKTFTCSDCGATKTQSVPKLTDNPITGDTSSIALWVAALLVAVCALAVLLILYFKKKQNN